MSSDSEIAAHFAVARPRVLAALTRQFSDLDAAEEAYQEACVRAMERWAADGVPRDPTGWMIMTGRNATIDRFRRDRRIVLTDAVPDNPANEDDVETALVDRIDMSELRDDVLRLMFMCCHPELDLKDQLALALKVIGGFSVDKIARAFVVKPKAMEQRITRAKKKAASVAERLDTPSLQERSARLDAVCAMAYLLFNEGYSASGGDQHIRTELCDEAIRLARLLLALFPSQAEVMGLLALCLFQHSRRRARLDADGSLITLEEQDRSLWNRQEIAEGQVLIEKALRHGRPGPYQIQAAIAAVHCVAETPDGTDWGEIERLYAALEQVQPTPVVSLNRAVALAKVKDAGAGLIYLEGVSEALSGYLYFHSTRASLLEEAGDLDRAVAAYERALELDPTEQEAAHIQQRIARCRSSEKKSGPM